MSVIETDRVFAAGKATLSAAPADLRHTRTPLNIGAAQIAAKLRRRSVTPGLLSAFARIGDFWLLAAASAVILWTYVAPGRGDRTEIRHCLAAAAARNRRSDRKFRGIHDRGLSAGHRRSRARLRLPGPQYSACSRWCCSS
jgi:hypothetical protein